MALHDTSRGWWLVGVGALIGIVLVVPVVSFAGGQALGQSALSATVPAIPDLLIFVSGTVLLALLFWVAVDVLPGHTRRRLLAVWLMVVAGASTAFFVWVALLDLSFTAIALGLSAPDTARSAPAAVASYVAPSLSALVAGVLVFRSGRSAMSPLVPPLAFIAVTAATATVALIAGTIPR